MSSYRDIEIKHSYFGKGTVILEEFLLPLLNEAASYDRVTSFYSIDSLVAVSQGVQSLFKHHGHMRLIIGLHSFPPELADAVLRKDFLREQIKQVREAITQGITTIGDSLQVKRLETLAWMIEDGLLSVKAASVAGKDGIFHAKTLILRDWHQNRIVAVGSANETAYGLGSNFEQLMVQKSWKAEDGVVEQEKFFDALWDNSCEDAIVADITKELSNALREGLGACRSQDNGNFDNLPQAITTNPLSLAADMPAHFFVSGNIPTLYPHQERAVLDALSRWPVRVLFADEVGLGKTFEAAATIAFLLKYRLVNRVLILTPKSVLQQWQDELHSNFDIDAWIYDSSQKVYFRYDGKEQSLGNSAPLAANAPSIVLMSSQFARGGGSKGSVFDNPSVELPDLLVLDEAHSARISRDISGKQKITRMYRALEMVIRRIPHVIFATATPMQRDADEYLALLKLLGLPKEWGDVRNFKTSLRLIASPETPSINEAARAGQLLFSTLRNMKPDLSALDPSERSTIDDLVRTGNIDRHELGLFTLNHWEMLYRTFVKLHPARLLTVRNTRRSLSEMGYKFPERILNDVSIEDSDSLKLLYMDVDDYISNICFSIERELYPDRKLNIGFVRISYRQRVSSSLYSCIKSLARRLSKIINLRNALHGANSSASVSFASFGQTFELDQINDDELLESGMDSITPAEVMPNVDTKSLIRAIETEVTAIPPLISKAESLLHTFGDKKIAKAIELVTKHTSAGEQVLIFSRYSDTVDALVAEFKKSKVSNLCYGIYTGQITIKVAEDSTSQRNKDEIKEDFSSGAIRAMFCSDAASEGLNLQAARVLINVDVPWTPARLEQRIGRVARLGQRASSVLIYNIWYPSSIEARMYRRIQKRLEESNIAVGEFPEVVAESIKNAVLSDDEQNDNSAQLLQEIRGSLQTAALQQLWRSKDRKQSISEDIRTQLALLSRKVLDDAVPQNQPHQEEDTYLAESSCISPDNQNLLKTSSQVCSWPNANDFVCMVDAMDNPAAFASRHNLSRFVRHDQIYNLISGEAPVEYYSDDEWPVTLANTSALNLGYAIESECPPRPEFWPPVSFEGDNCES